MLISGVASCQNHLLLLILSRKHKKTKLGQKKVQITLPGTNMEAENPLFVEEMASKGPFSTPMLFPGSVGIGMWMSDPQVTLQQFRSANQPKPSKVGFWLHLATTYHPRIQIHRELLQESRDFRIW